MKTKILILLYNPKTKEYIESLSNESDISWCEGWVKAMDFSDMFFIKRWILRLRLEYKFRDLGLSLRWKKVLVFDGVRGVV